MMNEKKGGCVRRGTSTLFYIRQMSHIHPPVWGHPVEKNRKKEVRKDKMMQNGIKWTLYTATPVRITSR